MKSPQVSRTLLSILGDLNNAVVWMVSTRPLISISSSSYTNILVTVASVPITIGITVTFMFYSFFSSLARSTYLSLFSVSFSFTPWSAGTATSTILQVLFFSFFSFFFFLLAITRSGRLDEIRWSVCISKSRRSLCVSFSRTDFGLCMYRLFTACECFLLVLSGGFSLTSERQEVSSKLFWVFYLILIRKCSERSWFFLLIFNFYSFWSLWGSFRAHYNWHHYHLHIPQFFLFSNSFLFLLINASKIY